MVQHLSRCCISLSQNLLVCISPFISIFVCLIMCCTVVVWQIRMCVSLVCLFLTVIELATSRFVFLVEWSLFYGFTCLYMIRSKHILEWEFVTDKKLYIGWKLLYLLIIFSYIIKSVSHSFTKILQTKVKVEPGYIVCCMVALQITILASLIEWEKILKIYIFCELCEN